MRAYIVSWSIAGLGLAAAHPVAAFAQAHTTGSPGRVAGIAPAAPTPPAAGSYRYRDVPMSVTSDGKVYADFGRGYEQLVRNCAVPLASFSQPGTAQPTAVQPLPYTPAVPNQQTPSQQEATRSSSVSNGQATDTRRCWSVDAHGQPLIGR
jgi:hypothetical protein